jgi:hypothetical protein
MEHTKWFPFTLRLKKQPKKKKGGEGEAITEEIPEEQAVLPRPRFNTMMTVARNQLFLYGGILDLEGNEHTLEDFWTINLDKMDEWKVLVESDLGHWEGSDDDAEDDEEDEENGDDDGDEEESDEEPELSTEEESCSDDDSKARMPVNCNRGKTAEQKAQELEDEKIQREAELRAQLAMEQNLPKPGETLREYFARTSTYWVERTFEEEQAQGAGVHGAMGKALRRDGT